MEALSLASDAALRQGPTRHRCTVWSFRLASTYSPSGDSARLVMGSVSGMLVWGWQQTKIISRHYRHLSQRLLVIRKAGQQNVSKATGIRTR